MSSLRALLADAQERGPVARNVARDLKGRRQKGKNRQANQRQNGKLKIGVDIPARHRLRPLWRPYRAVGAR